jgi:flavin-dependent dehydrogenase
VQPEPRFVHALDLDSGIEQTYCRDYWNVDRRKFDDWLLGLARRRAGFLPGTRFVSARRADVGFEVLLRRNGAEETVTCRHVVGADGATSQVRSQLSSDVPAVPRMIAVQASLPRCPSLSTQEVLFSPGLTDYYAWAIPKPDSVLVGSAFTDLHSARSRFARILDTICRRYGLENRVLRTCSRFLSRPTKSEQLCPGSGRVLLVGEAAGLVSPSSGEGISFALRSGMAAGAALGSGEPSRAYGRAFRRLSGMVSRKFLKARVIFAPRLRRLALRVPFYP